MKVNALVLGLTVLALTAGVSAHAEEAPTSNADTNTSKAKLPEVANTPKREDIDSEITNARLRATTGAKSLWSVQSSLNYNGGSVQTPLAQQRPQLSPGTVENDPAKLTGAISAKYRMTDHDNLNLGIGVGWLTPTYSGQKGQVEDPYANYSRVFKAAGLQNVFDLGLTKYTADSSVNQRHLNYETDIDHTILGNIGNTKLQLGLTAAWTRELYNSNGPADGSIQDTLAAYPFAEYEFTDMLSFRTVYRGFTYYNTTDNAGTFVRDDATQSAGVGIAVARDVYFYPNVQWVWGDVRAEKTNVALSANINL